MANRKHEPMTRNAQTKTGAESSQPVVRSSQCEGSPSASDQVTASSSLPAEPSQPMFGGRTGGGE